MLLTPRYDGPPVLVDESPIADPVTPLVRQRARLGAVLADLTDAQWRAPTRCEGWTVRDVVSHLVTTNQFWAASIDAGCRGEPTRILAAFDPVATPAALVDATQDASAELTRDLFCETAAALAASVRAVDDWTALAEAPPGHVALALVAAHALWDAWIHERDILLPLGLEQEQHDDEVVMSLRYAAALGPTLAATRGSTRTGAFVIDAVDPTVELTVAVGPTVVLSDGVAPGVLALRAPAVELLEGLTFRSALPCAVADDDAWLIAGLDAAFDRV